MKIICTLSHLSLSFGSKKLFDQTGLTLFQGDKIGLLGLNGHGKSSLFRIFTGQLSADTSTPPFTFDRSKAFCNDQNNLDAFLVPQDPPLLPNDKITVKDYLWRFYPKLLACEDQLKKINQQLDSNPEDQKALEQQKQLMDEIEHLGGWSLQQRYESYLKVFNLKDWDALMTQLSGGEQKKVLLSLGLSCPHPIILWDEPTNHLDLETLEMIEDELLASDKTFLVISHDRYFLSKVTNKIFSIEKQKIHSFQGNYSDYLDHIQVKEEMRQQLLSKLKNSLKRETQWMRQGIKARGTRSKKRVENYHELRGQVTQVKDDARRRLEMAISHSSRKTKKLVELVDVNFSYSTKPLFNNLNCSVWKEDKIGIIGPNGVGKSTLLKILSGDLAVQDGQVHIAHGLNISHYTQKREELEPEMTAYQYLGEGDDTLTLASGQTQHILSYFEKFLFNRGDIHRPLKYFSGGEKNRLQLAKHLLNQADLWIFDEPTNDLDLETLEILEQTLRDYKGALILISHDRAFLAQVTNKIWSLEPGRLESFQGGYAQAEEYLASLRLERSLTEDGPDSISARPAVVEKKEVQVNQEQLKSKITQFEAMIEQIQGRLQEMEAQADFGADQARAYGELAKTLSDLEDKLLELYQQEA